MNFFPPSAHTLKVLDLTVSLFVPLRLCKELEAMVEHIMLEAMSFKVCLHVDDIENCIRSIIEEVEKVLVKPGWSALKLEDRFPLNSHWEIKGECRKVVTTIS